MIQETGPRYFQHHIRRFVRESNEIEGLFYDVGDNEVTLLASFLSLDDLHLAPLVTYVKAVAAAELRDKPGMNVRVGDHIPLPGGLPVKKALIELLADANDPRAEPYCVHCEYETLHPFMDGNGRSGRAIWAWMMWKRGYRLERAFLHEFYYQALQAYE